MPKKQKTQAGAATEPGKYAAHGPRQSWKTALELPSKSQEDQ